MDECKDLQIVNENINVENIWYEVTNPLTRESFIVAVIYRHPIYAKMALDTFNKDLKRSVDILSKENKWCIICGDINYCEDNNIYEDEQNGFRKKVKKLNLGVKVEEELVSILAFDYDIVIIANSEKELQQILKCVETWCKNWRFKSKHRKN